MGKVGTGPQTRGLGQTVSGATFLSTLLSLLSLNLPWPRTPLPENTHWHPEPLDLPFLPCIALALWVSCTCSVPHPPAFLCFIGPFRMFCFTWWSLVHPSYPGPAPCDLTELIHISFMTPTFLKSLCVIVFCVHMHMHVCVPVCLCVQVHVCAGVCVHVHLCAGMCMHSYPCMCMWRSEDNIRCHLHQYHVLPLRECLSCWLGAHQLVYIGWSRSLRDCPVSTSLALRLQGNHHAQLSTWRSGSYACKASISLTEQSLKWSHVFY